MCQLRVGTAAAKQMGTFEYTAKLGDELVTVELPVTHTDAQLIRKVKKAFGINGVPTTTHYDEDTIRLVAYAYTVTIYLFASDVPQA